jgi:hypothetical protein
MSPAVHLAPGAAAPGAGLRVFSCHLALNPGTQAVIVHYPTGSLTCAGANLCD